MVRTHPFPLRRLKIFVIGPQILKKFYSCTIKSVLTAWYGNCSASDHKALQRVVRTAQYITGAKLPVIQALYTLGGFRGRPKNVSKTAVSEVLDFSLLPHGKWSWSANSRFNRLLNRFYPQAIRLLNNELNGHQDYLH